MTWTPNVFVVCDQLFSFHMTMMQEECEVEMATLASSQNLVQQDKYQQKPHRQQKRGHDFVVLKSCW